PDLTFMTAPDCCVNLPLAFTSILPPEFARNFDDASRLTLGELPVSLEPAETVYFPAVVVVILGLVTLWAPPKVSDRFPATMIVLLPPTVSVCFPAPPRV